MDLVIFFQKIEVDETKSGGEELLVGVDELQEAANTITTVLSKHDPARGTIRVTFMNITDHSD